MQKIDGAEKVVHDNFNMVHRDTLSSFVKHISDAVGDILHHKEKVVNHPLKLLPVLWVNDIQKLGRKYIFFYFT